MWKQSRSNSYATPFDRDRWQQRAGRKLVWRSAWDAFDSSRHEPSSSFCRQSCIEGSVLLQKRNGSWEGKHWTSSAAYPRYPQSACPGADEWCTSCFLAAASGNRRGGVGETKDDISPELVGLKASA